MNSVNLIGRMGRDPEIKNTSSGKTVANFSVAVDDGFGEKKQTHWFNCTAWQKTAEAVGKYTSKGSLVAVTGRLQTRSWEKEGKKHSVVEIVAEQVQFLSKSEGRGEESQEVPDEDIPF